MWCWHVVEASLAVVEDFFWLLLLAVSAGLKGEGRGASVGGTSRRQERVFSSRSVSFIVSQIISFISRSPLGSF